MELPLISIIVPCYNQAHYLPATLESILAQDYRLTEIIVVNDGSKDETASVAARYGDSIRYIEQANAGLSGARNSGIRAARGELLVFLDSDDMLAPDYLRLVAEASLARPDVGVFHSGWRYVDEHGRPEEQVDAAELGASPIEALLSGNRFPVHAGVVRRNIVEDLGFFSEELRACEDWDYWLRAAAHGSSFAPVPGAYALYRRYGGSMSTDYVRMWTAGQQVLGRARERLPDEYRLLVEEGLTNFRRYLVRRLYQRMRRSGPLEATNSLVRALVSDARVAPALLARVGRAVLSRTRRAWGSGFID